MSAEMQAKLVVMDTGPLITLAAANSLDYLRTQGMIPVTTRDFLVGLEAARRINSADESYRQAEDAGRLASQRAVFADQHEQARGRRAHPAASTRSMKTNRHV